MKTISYSHIGTRQNNEDSFGSNKTSFVVCDGMGGHTSGEVASKLVVDEVLQLIKKEQPVISKEAIEEFLEKVQVSLNKKLETQPELLKMGTTFTGVFFRKEGLYVSHIGDSRVYVVRPSEEKIWHTWDHSLVGGLMKSGEITREKGRLHPMSNRISKAITANDKRKTVTADIVRFDSIQKGDLILLCTDGVNEAWKEHELMGLLCDTNLTTSEKLKQVEVQCAKESRDNNTAILLEIEEVDEIDNGNNEEISWFALNDFTNDYATHLANEEKEAAEEIVQVEPEENLMEQKNEEVTGRLYRKYIYIILIAIIVLALVLFN